MTTQTTNIAAITGAAGALGAELARSLVGRGYRVALFDTDSRADRLADLVAQLGPGRAASHASDFSSPASWAAALDATSKALGALPSHAVLSAGGWAGGSPLVAMADDSTYAEMMRVNADATYRALRALLPAMVQAKRGSIVVIGSRAVERPWTSAGSAAYAAAKAAVVSLSQAVAEEVRPYGVRINAVLPSTMDTPANRAAMPHVDPATWVSLPSAAGIIAFLLSDEARDVSGAALPVYGRA